MQKEKNFWKGAAVVSLQMLGNMALFAGAIATIVFTVRRPIRKYKKIDLKIFDVLDKYTNEKNNKLMNAFTFFGTHDFFIPANLLLIFYLLFIKKRSWLSILVASIAISSLLLMFLLKYLFHRRRPLVPLLQKARGQSFPSGHAIMSVTFYGLLIYMISQTIHDKRAKYPLIIFLILFVQMIGFSRVYLRVHYASDIAAGYIIGFAWLKISLKTLQKIEDGYQQNKFFIRDEKFSSQSLN